MNMTFAMLIIGVLLVIAMVLVTVFSYDCDIMEAWPVNIAFFVVAVLFIGSIYIINVCCEQKVVKTEESYEYTYDIKKRSACWPSDENSYRLYNDIKYEVVDGEKKVVVEKLKPKKIEWWPLYSTKITVYIDQNDQDEMKKIVNSLIN